MFDLTNIIFWYSIYKTECRLSLGGKLPYERAVKLLFGGVSLVVMLMKPFYGFPMHEVFPFPIFTLDIFFSIDIVYRKGTPPLVGRFRPLLYVNKSRQTQSLAAFLYLTCVS